MVSKSARKGKMKRAAGTAAGGLAQGLLDYFPAEREWRATPAPAPAGRGLPDPYTLELTDGRGRGGVRVATIKVEPSLSEEAARRIGLMIGHAPRLFRTLRDVNALQLATGPDGLRDFAETTGLLWDAVDQPPYEPAAAREDNGIEDRESEGTLAAMAEGGGHGL